ncbi:hypothetical protein BO94DRAFT_621274 [Aspergillus sclerotioniger CBS 115572]|uniref:Copper-fist domain-containing protein n=1 Tax=Aspergillus sclerotioniger CBS 115572 TaxID=1450535 RepID=A0A317X9G1_9EURO|nr:hypothetical protein BO94DRAFT_621274 [Aspergillus sclerotioniger CBS 115572]PWY94821.1 hypothetical protein BO94DRAFT_621274 [Aspergillus sclerotioniger CBS 115572]
MPLDEEGAKWSCEPCIRGHRSSKCQHFDRMMMKVPKAGRPLAKCPHPKGTCSCQKLYAFMIRIPKGSTCLCRPVYQVPANAAESVSTTPIPAAPMPSAAPNKIQKQVKRQIKTAPENLTKALSSIPEFGKQHLENGMPNRPPPYVAQKERLSDSYNTVNRDLNSSHETFDQASKGKISQGSSCCSRKPKPPTPTPAPHIQRSCCGKPKSPAGNIENVGNGGPVFSSPDHFNPSDFENGDAKYMNSIPQVSTWQDFQAAKQSQYMQPFSLFVSDTGFFSVADTVTHIPHTPMAFSHQQSYENYRLFQDSTTQPLSEYAQNAVPGPASTENEAEAAHDCSCGDGCQCLGCASHPFNNTTRQHVQEMGLLVSLNDDEQNLERLNTRRGSPLQGQLSDFSSLQYPYSNFGHLIGDGAQPIAMHSYAQQSTNSGHVNSGYSSPPPEYLGQQLMEPSEYYTLEYPVGLPSACADTTGSCQCGNDCTCVGCLTHSGHNGVALEPTMAANNWGHMDVPTFSTESADTNTSQMPVFENFMVHPNSML